jgi:DNA mismatch repair protein MutS2
LDESRKRLENLVRELREGEITREKTKAVKQFLKEMEEPVIENEDVRETRGLDADGQEANEDSNLPYLRNQPTPLVLESGMEVLLKPRNTPATLLRQADAESWVVQAGSMKLTVKESDMALAPSYANTRSTHSAVSVTVDYAEGDAGVMRSEPVPELRLLGMRQDEALKSLERQLDLAAIHGLQHFSIIHGKGSGVLQQAAWDYLKAYPGVREFHFARPEDGGTGKTYVEMG